jgi:hypothetical protein
VVVPGEHALAAGRERDGDDVGLVHHLRLGSEVRGDRDFAAVGAMS